MLDTNALILLIVLLFIIAAITIAVAVIVITSNRKLLTINTSNNKQYRDAIKDILKVLANDYTHVTAPNSGKSLVNTLVKLGAATKENCVATMNTIGAIRIAVYLFHNGTHTPSGIDFVKASCICEKVSIGSGVKERMMEHTNIPINLFGEMINTLNSYNRYIIINNENLGITEKMLVSADKVTYVQLVTIYDIDNNVLGFISAEMDKVYSKDSADEEKKVLDELAKQLTPVLSFSEYTHQSST